MINSDCTAHITWEKYMFAQFVEDLSSTSSIFFGYNKIRKALGLGNVAITNDLSIENVMLVKSIP